MSGRVCLLLFLFLFGCSRSVEYTKDDIFSFAAEGVSLTAAEVADLEDTLEEWSGDIAVRVKLLGYYFEEELRSPEAREAKERHVLWMIWNVPESPIFSTPYGHLYPEVNDEAYTQAKRCWLRQLRDNPDNPIIKQNAFGFFDAEEGLSLEEWGGVDFLREDDSESP